jgi:Cd(II)/Pb(II)-responsive transcriptional regulator
MKIGELARATGTSIETIRFYERAELLPHPERTGGNYRNYGDAHAERLGFIRHCRSLDMTLDEIRVLLQFKDSPGENCGGVDTLLDQHIGHVTERIRELKALEKHLKQLRLQCTTSHAGQDCGILRELSESAAAGHPAARKQRHVHGAH